MILRKSEGPVLFVPSSCEIYAHTHGKGIVGSLGIVTYISEAAILLCSLSKERLCSVRHGGEGTEHSLDNE